MTEMRHEALKLLWAEINETRRRQAEAERLEDPVQRAEAMEAQKSRRAVLEWIEGEVRHGERPEDDLCDPVCKGCRHNIIGGIPNVCWDCVNGCNKEACKNEA